MKTACAVYSAASVNADNDVHYLCCLELQLVWAFAGENYCMPSILQLVKTAREPVVGMPQVGLERIKARSHTTLATNNYSR